MLPAIAAATHFGASAPFTRESMRVSPVPESGKYALNKLVDALDKRVESTGRAAPGLAVDAFVPDNTLAGKYDAFANNNTYSSSGRTDAGNFFVTHNPNASRELLAHELGHVAAQNTDVGEFISRTRHSPALRNSIAKAALMTLPAGALAAAMPGDGDIDESVALAALVAAPEILDEANATRHALGIMKDAGMPADRGQRTRLAGGLLSYMALPLVMGGSANVVGNMLDEDQPIA